ncbi:hypothetical protein H4W31_005292 [Plantactinospora soyae]|uniref:Uncharacterized protein n=1 Tax=Plantactinospora soyae TaxID=1544732 RepID=A0A927M804_9ACTN|nr:hypothetical protein [Plantactinospora soyae]
MLGLIHLVLIVAGPFLVGTAVTPVAPNEADDLPTSGWA